MIRLGINGFGRTGRTAARIALERDDVKLVAINSRSDPNSHAYLLKYDSVHGTFPHKVKPTKKSIIVDDNEILCFQKDLPSQIPWNKAKADIVIEATGKFKDRSAAGKHIKGCVKKVIISAPTPTAQKTIVMGVNEKEYDFKKHNVISNASCTTNCLAVICKVVDKSFDIVRGTGITIHAPTLTQSLLDRSNQKDIRRGRAAFINIIPTTTGAAKALGWVLPNLTGKLKSTSIRVPAADGSLMLLNIEVKRRTTVKKINSIFKTESRKLAGILDYSQDEIVSQDIVGNKASAIIDPFFTEVVANTFLSIYAWYDNEMGYSARLIDLAVYMGNSL